MVVKLTRRKSVMVCQLRRFDCFAWFVGYVNDLHKLFSSCPTQIIMSVAKNLFHVSAPG